MPLQKRRDALHASQSQVRTAILHQQVDALQKLHLKQGDNNYEKQNNNLSPHYIYIVVFFIFVLL